MASSSSTPQPLRTLDETLLSPLPANKTTANLARKALVAKVLTTRILNRNAVKEVLYKAWQGYEGILISDKGPNMFLLTFKEELHVKDVIKKAPWYVMNHLVSLQYWVPEAAIAELDFSHNPFWISATTPQHNWLYLRGWDTHIDNVLICHICRNPCLRW